MRQTGSMFGVWVWGLLIVTLVVGGVVAMLVTMGAIGRATDELVHDRLSVRFWALLAGLGLVVAGAFAVPVAANDWAHTSAGQVMAVLIKQNDRTVEGGLAQSRLGEKEGAFETELGGVLGAHGARPIWAG